MEKDNGNGSRRPIESLLHQLARPPDLRLPHEGTALRRSVPKLQTTDLPLFGAERDEFLVQLDRLRL